MDKLDSMLPLAEGEDGILIIVDKQNWTLRVAFEGSVFIAEHLGPIFAIAKQMLQEKMNISSEEEKEPTEAN